MSMAEAVSRFVPDGAWVAMGPCLEPAIPFAAGHEMIRQRRRGLTLVPERRQLYPNLSAADNVVLGCYSWTRSVRKARTSDAFAFALDLFPDLRPHLGQAAGTLSGGQQQMVAIARGLAAAPRILAVDEPCLGLAEAVSRRVYEALSRVHQAGAALIVVEEAPRRALQICDRRVDVRNGVIRPAATAPAPEAGD